jgi:hypothetical protein
VYADALQEADVLDCIHQIISKSLTYAQENIRQDTRYILIYWDGEYAVMTIVYCDEMWVEDSFHVVKCCFRALDKYDLLHKACSSEDDEGNPNEEYYNEYLKAVWETEEIIFKLIETTLKLPHISNTFKQLKEKGIHLCYTESPERDFIKEIIIDSNTIKYQVIEN